MEDIAIAKELRRLCGISVKQWNDGYVRALIPNDKATLGATREGILSICVFIEDPLIQNQLRKLRKRNKYFNIYDAGNLLSRLHTGMTSIANVLDPPVGIEADTVAEGLTGPESSREEVVGISTQGKSSNLSNSGFGGGSIERLEAA